MKQIRRNVFETNSSSSHAISFSNSKHNLDYTQLVPDINGVIHCHFGQFGWWYSGGGDTNSAKVKLNYLITQICETNDCIRPWCCEKYEIQETAESVMETDDFKMLEEDIVHTLKEQGINAKKIVVDSDREGYVDHQSVCAIKNILPDECGTYSDFVFDKGYDLLITNDNAYSEDELSEVAQNNDSIVVKWLYLKEKQKMDKGYMFKVKKKDEIGAPMWRIFQIMPMPTQFGSISFQLLGYNETTKVFDLIDAKDYEIVDEVAKSALL